MRTQHSIWYVCVRLSSYRVLLFFFPVRHHNCFSSAHFHPCALTVVQFNLCIYLLCIKTDPCTHNRAAARELRMNEEGKKGSDTEEKRERERETERKSESKTITYHHRMFFRIHNVIARFCNIFSDTAVCCCYGKANIFLCTQTLPLASFYLCSAYVDAMADATAFLSFSYSLYFISEYLLFL